MHSFFNKYQVSVMHIIAAAILFLITIYATAVAEAASPYGRYGWTDPVTSIDGDDFSCADPAEVALTLEVRDRDTNATTTVASAIIAIYDKTGPTKVYVTHAEGVGPRIGPVCYNPDTDSVAYDIDGGASYRNFYSSFVDQTPGLMPRQKAVTGVVWVTPVSFPAYEYRQVSPSPSVVQVINVNPSYTYQVNYLHNAYGADALSMVNLFVVNFDPSIPNYTTTTISKVVNQSGGVGNKTIPAEPLADGWYGWSLYLHLNKNHTISGSYEALNVPKSGFLNLWAPFVLDTTPPIFTSLTHTPVLPASTSTITISSNATDALIGVTKQEIYVDGVLNKICNFWAVTDSVCNTTVGPFAEGSTHTYYVRATDYAGNIATSTTYSFAIELSSCPPGEIWDGNSCELINSSSLTCTDNTTIIVDSAQALNGSWAGTPQAMKKLGSLVYVGASGDSDTYGLYIFDVSDPSNIVQRSFFSTHSPVSVQNNFWGNDVLGLDVVGNYAYLATYYGGLVIVDVTDVDAPTFAGKVPLYNLNPPGSKETWDVEVSGNYAFLASGKGLIVVDVGNKASPVVVANLNLSDAISQDIILSGNYAYVAMRDEGFFIIDISDPTNPVQVAHVSAGYGAGAWAYALEKKGEILYVGNNYSELVDMYNVADPSTPIFVGSVSVSIVEGNSAPRELYAEGDALYVSADYGGLYVFDITTPALPTQLIRIPKPPFPDTAKVWAVSPLDAAEPSKLVVISEDTLAGVYITMTLCEDVQDLYSENVTPTSGTGFLNTQDITFTGRAVNTAAAPIIQGGWADLEIDWNSDGGPQADGGTGFDDNYNAFGGSQLGSFTPGQSKNLSYTISAGSALVGTHRYRFNVDTDGTGVIESDETNNRSAWVTFTVGEATCPTDETMNWTVGGESCTGTIGSTARYVGESETVTDLVEDPATGMAAFLCRADATWDPVPKAATCAVPSPLATPVDVTVSVDRELIRVGETASVTIAVNVRVPTTCTVYGVNNTPFTFTHGGAPAAQSYEYLTRGLTATQLVSATCVPDPAISGVVAGTDEQKIEVVPEIQER